MEANEFYSKVMDNVFEGVYFVDNERRITYWNKGAEKITGFTAGEVVGKRCYDNILNHVDESGKKLCFGGCPLQRTLGDEQVREASVYLHHKNGQRVPVSIRVVPFFEQGKITGAIEFFVDNSELHENIRETENYRFLAMTDPLTGIPNRRYLDTFLESKYKEYHSLGISLGVLFIDVDYFKRFNDTYGHETGDEVLRMISRTFMRSTRSTDLIGRFGGEEFLAVFSGLDEVMLMHKAEQFRMLIETSSIRAMDEELRVTVSIGATMLKDGESIGYMLERADRLLYESKKNGRNQVTLG